MFEADVLSSLKTVRCLGYTDLKTHMLVIFRVDFFVVNTICRMFEIYPSIDSQHLRF